MIKAPKTSQNPTKKAMRAAVDHIKEAVDRANALSSFAGKAKVILNAQKARAGRIEKMHKSLSKNLIQAKKMMKSKDDSLISSLSDTIKSVHVLMNEEISLVSKFGKEYEDSEKEANEAIEEAIDFAKGASDFWTGDKIFVVATTVLAFHRSSAQDDCLESSPDPKSPQPSPSYDPYDK